MIAVVSDTTVLNLLIQIDCISIVESLFQEVLVPTVVLEELRHANTPAVVKEYLLKPPRWLKERNPLQSYEGRLLGRGEAAAIGLALEIQSPLLIDERIGRSVAESLGLTILGAIGLLERAAQRGLIADLAEIHDRIRKTTFRISERLMANSLHRYHTK